MSKANFKVTVIDSSRELTAREKIALKDTADAIKLDEATKNGKVEIEPAFYAVLSVHNEKLANPDYEQYIVVDVNGTKYTTGSTSFFESFTEIFDALMDDTEPYTVIVSRIPSKNYTGKEFLTCSLKL